MSPRHRSEAGGRINSLAATTLECKTVYAWSDCLSQIIEFTQLQFPEISIRKYLIPVFLVAGGVCVQRQSGDRDHSQKAGRGRYTVLMIDLRP